MPSSPGPCLSPQLTISLHLVEHDLSAMCTWQQSSVRLATIFWGWGGACIENVALVCTRNYSLKWSVKERGNEQDVSLAFVLQGWLPNEH